MEDDLGNKTHIVIFTILFLVTALFASASIFVIKWKAQQKISQNVKKTPTSAIPSTAAIPTTDQPFVLPATNSPTTTR